MINRLIFITFFVLIISCSHKHDEKPVIENDTVPLQQDTVIVDCDYTFSESIEGTKAPQYIIDQLVLVNVKYYSTDGKIHAGQLVTNQSIADDLKHLFGFMLEQKFPVKSVIPVVRFNWDDNSSMEANNSYSFCYRNATFSKHAKGMAIDINPLFNPLRWKNEKSHLPNKPANAKYNTEIPGTFYDSHPVVEEFRKFGFRWGRTFTRSYDDHHFEK